MKKQQVRDITRGTKLMDKIANGVAYTRAVALASYGVNSGNVLIPHRFGEPLISHDGITNIGRLVSEDDIVNSAISVIRQAAEKTNRVAGDATSLTTIMACELYDYYDILRDKAENWKEQMHQDRATILSYLDSIVVPAKDKDLYNIAKTSSGDEAIARLVAEAVETVGKDGGISIVEVPDPYVQTETFSGALLNTGLKSPAFATDLSTVSTSCGDSYIVILGGIYKTSADILPILQRVLEFMDKNTKRPVILIGDISGQALEVIVQNKNRGVFEIAVVEPETDHRETLLEDLACYTSCAVFKGNPSEYEPEKYMGAVASAKITLSETVLEGKKAKDTSELEKRVEGIENKLNQTNLSEAERRHYEKRYSVLCGKAVKILVGANSQAERQELKLRIEDAVCATQAAQKYGILPGGGVALRNCAAECEGSPKDLLNIPFRYLTNKEPGDYAKDEGMDITTGKTVKVMDAGIIDSYLAISEAVNNAYSVAESLLSVTLALPFHYKEWECENER